MLADKKMQRRRIMAQVWAVSLLFFVMAALWQSLSVLR